MPSLLVLQMPPRPRLGSGEPPGAAPPAEFAYAWSPDGRQVQRQGRAAPALLPRADAVVAVLSEVDVGWQRCTLPKAPPARLRAALSGVLEEALLEEPEQVHLALPAEARAGEPSWIAVAHRGWLRAELAALEQAQVFVDRIVPAAWPADPPRLHIGSRADPTQDATTPAALVATWSQPDGVVQLPLQGSLARALLPQPLPVQTLATATPATAAAAEAWLGAPVALATEAERLLQAAQSPWDLRQFDLVRRHRGTRALRDAWRGFLGPAWRPARYGLAALVLVQLAGLNLQAWQLRRQVERKQADMVALLQTTFPQVRAVLDAPLQMEREVQALRGQAGRAGESDLEPLMRAAAAAWPPGRPPVDGLRFEPGRLSLPASGWTQQEIDRFRQTLRTGGYGLEQSDGRLHIRRSPAGGSPS
ncbi:type II secretion system protein GspL [Piscinibacter sakaiensis]|uniref:General secretion pathway protein L n=1 Tax=Piscinibacter sakaiensis TaxID=1547922 RepID=A0A0K8NXA0_PISS1|nr:type II secretion system protein GspL [Piscinibacter sakaiensis]GAP34555.1 general secretion pathway protein L [Piscinibacter sakaiensis]